MATTTNSNVINLQPGGPQLAGSANRILLECRDMGVRQLRTALRNLLQTISEAAQHEADTAAEMDRRRFLSRFLQLLNDRGGRLEGQLAAHWTAGYDDALRKGGQAGIGKTFDFDDLQIVDFGDMDEDLAVKAFAQRLESKCESDLYALGRRFSHLSSRGNEAEAGNPLAPTILAQALRDGMRDAGLDTEFRLECWRRLETLAETRIAPVFHAINAHLVQHNILPDVRREYRRQSPAANARNESSGQAPKDMFAVLQSLVSGGKEQPATPAPGTPGPAGARAGESLPASRLPQFWASLESIQHAPLQAELPAGSAGFANLLHGFRMSEAGQELQQVDAITVDIVAMLFDMIFDDREIPDPIKALVGKLQIPILKVALLDRGFFSSKAHPTRRLLDLISRAALRWGDQIGHDDPVYRKISQVVDHLHSHFKQDTELFATLCDDLESFLKQHEAAADGTTRRAALLVVQREHEELADIAIDGELRPLLATSPVAIAHDLLDHEWRAVLQQIYLDEGIGSEAWSAALATANGLVDSVTAKREVQERRGLARNLPDLLRQLNAGFDRIKLATPRRHALMDALFAIHSALLRGNEPAAEAADQRLAENHRPAAEPDLASRSLADGEITVHSISVTLPVLASAAAPGIESLQRGDWVEYQQPEGLPMRYRLSWISPQRGIFLFTNPHSPNALAVSPEAMSLQLQRGEVRILSTEPIFDRALIRTIDTLKAA